VIHHIGITQKLGTEQVGREVNNLNTARFLNGSGTQTSTLAFGGYTGSASAKTEGWNGTTWTETSDLATARYTIGGAGLDATDGLAFGGATPIKSNTEEFTAADFQIKSVTTS